MVEWVIFLLHIQEVTGSNVSTETGYSDVILMWKPLRKVPIGKPGIR
jgi:hypothetical protein